ncbi:MAG: hypothetical protein Q7R79_04150 [bacterium]|nr:hypothetical protein [bacterium]
MFEENEQEVGQQKQAGRPQDIFQEQEASSSEEIPFSENDHERPFLSKKLIFSVLGGIFVLILIAVGVQVSLNVFKQQPEQAVIPSPPQQPAPPTQPVQPPQQPIPPPQTPIKSSPGGDDDKDGLSNQEEEKLGTSKDNVDSDTDGLSDREEVHVYKTNPLNYDTDADGYTDGDEVKNGFDPNGPGKLRVIPPQ